MGNGKGGPLGSDVTVRGNAKHSVGSPDSCRTCPTCGLSCIRSSGERESSSSAWNTCLVSGEGRADECVCVSMPIPFLSHPLPFLPPRTSHHTPPLTTTQCPQPRKRKQRKQPQRPRSTLHTMPYVSKAEWTRRLQELGEEPPPAWTVQQLQARRSEIVGEEEKSPSKDMKNALKEMTAASRKKKAEFAIYLKDHGLTYGTNDTVVQMVSKAERQIMERFERQDDEVMGFGKFAAHTMVEVWKSKPSYVEWCQTIMSEEEVSWRFKRFVIYTNRKKAEAQFAKLDGKPKGKIPLKPIRQTMETVTEGHMAAEADGFTTAPQVFNMDQELQPSSSASYSVVTMGAGSCASFGNQNETEGDLRELEEHSALALTKSWQPRKNAYSAAWQQLTHGGRPLLMEVACFEDSVLSQVVESRFGKGSAVRCGLFNGCDLENPAGIRAIKVLIQKLRPVHVWISCDCGPFCPL